MSKQPEALRLAQLLAPDEFSPATLTERQAAAELRRLHAMNGELMEALKGCVRIIRNMGTGATNIDRQQSDPKSALNEARAAIAKAESHPIMLAAARDLVSLITENVTSRNPQAGVYVIDTHDTDAAIAKATGEQP